MRWIKLTFAGWALGFALILCLIAISGALGLGDFQFPLGLGMGLGVGWVQSRWIAGITGSRAPWLRASTLGVTLPFVLWDIISLATDAFEYRLPLLVALSGLTTGVLEWRVLHRNVSRAVWWIPASLAGWSLAAATTAFDYRLLPRFGAWGALIYVAVILSGGLLLGAATAPMLRGAGTAVSREPELP